MWAPPGRDLGDVEHATLVLGRVSFGTDPTRDVVGEVPLSAPEAPAAQEPGVLPAPQED